MLVLSRKVDEIIDIGGHNGIPLVTIMVVAIQGDKVRIGIDAPKSIEVHRREISQDIAAHGKRGSDE